MDAEDTKRRSAEAGLVSSGQKETASVWYQALSTNQQIHRLVRKYRASDRIGCLFEREASAEAEVFKVFQ